MAPTTPWKSPALWRDRNAAVPREGSSTIIGLLEKACYRFTRGLEKPVLHAIMLIESQSKWNINQPGLCLADTRISCSDVLPYGRHPGSSQLRHFLSL